MMLHRASTTAVSVPVNGDSDAVHGEAQPSRPPSTIAGSSHVVLAGNSVAPMTRGSGFHRRRQCHGAMQRISPAVASTIADVM